MASADSAEVRIDDLFARQAAATPDAVAVLWRGQMLSYGQLMEAVAGFADELAACGVGPGLLVALCLARTPAMIALVLATLKAGGAYLPLDPRQPAERMAFMLSDSKASVLIADIASPAWNAFPGTILELSEGRLARRAAGPPVRAGPSDLAYVIYTSGSTGMPKGVMLSHAATHLVAWAKEAYSAEERSRVAATTSLSFDPSVFEIFMPLSTGGAVLLKDDALEPFGAEERPTMLDTVPSVLRELCRADAIPHSVQVLNVGGEPLGADLVDEVYRRRPGLTIYNHYGPTEATTCATVSRLPRDLVGEPSLGRPVRGASITLLSPAGERTPQGQVGEIHIGGAGLALGYLNRPDLTAERFVVGDHGRLYRTGDLGVWRDGELHFAGRMDRQIKVRGHRIEPAEIEAVLLRDPRIERALVTPREGAGGVQLIAYVQAQHSPAPATLRHRLTGSLPGYMVPAHIVVLRAFPQQVSGKIDHAALPDPISAPMEPAGTPSRAERPILHVFEEVLGRAVGPNESFFDLGGDSLTSVRAALRLEEVLGHDVPAALLHQAPSARALAAALEHARAQPTSHLSLLQPGGPEVPLFCVADLFGRPFNYLSLARQLAPDRAVYGLSPGPLQASFTATGDVDRLIDGFRTTIRRVQPQGPYFIAGYSVGGLLASGLAGALEREGQSARLVLLDSVLQSPRPPLAVLGRWGLGRARDLLTHKASGKGSDGLRARAAHLVRLFRSKRPPDWIPRGQVAFATRLIKVAGAYRPAPITAPVLMVIARDRDPAEEIVVPDGLSGWAGILQGDVTEAHVPGDHHQFMREPHVAATAQVVRRFLDRPADG